MSVFNREEEYLKLLRQRAYTVKELSSVLYVSQPTVRRDLIVLKEKDLLVCQRGVVRLKGKTADQRIPLFVRDLESTEEKTAIGKTASLLVKDGDVIFMDASTTACHILPYLKNYKNLLLITNGATAAITATGLGIKTICTGGEMTPESLSFVGTDTEDLLKRYNADLAFFSCRGISEDGFVTDNSILENAVRRIMIRQAKKAYLVCDRSKMGKTFLNTLCHRDELCGVITE